MPTDYPTAVDTTSKLPNPSAANNTNNPSHAGLHDNENDAIKATQTKVGTGATAPATSTLLVGTGAGTSAWQGLTSAQLAAILSDETGTGSAVFSNTPVLITPKVDTINENTTNNGVTIGGVNLKAGAISTSNAVPAAAIQNASITPSKLSLGLQTSSNTASAATTTSGTYVTQLSDSVTNAVTVTIGANGIALVIVSFFGFVTSNTADAYASFVGSGANTVAASDNNAVVYGVGPSGGGTGVNTGASKITTLTGLTVGSTTFTLQYRATGGTLTASQRSITVIPL